MRVEVNAVTASRVLSALTNLKREGQALDKLSKDTNDKVIALVEAGITDPNYDPQKLGGIDMDHISEGYVTLRMKDDGPTEEIVIPVEAQPEAE